MTPARYWLGWIALGLVLLVAEYLVVRAAVGAALRAWRP
jgi:hypothetical protein